MKILHIHPYPPQNLGGSEIYTKNLIIRLKQKDIDCEFLTSDIMNTKKKIGYLNQSIKVIYKKSYYNLWGKNPIVNIYSFLKQNIDKYDIIHAHSYIFFTSIQCALLKKYRKFPFIMHTHGGINTPFTLSSNFYEQMQLFFKQKIFDKTFGRFTIESADVIISVSNKDRILIQKQYKVDKKNNLYIPNGVDIEKFKKKYKLEKEYLTFIGRLSYIKGFDIFIKIIKEIYKRNKGLKFLIIGNGPLKNLVINAKKKLPIKYYSYYPYNKIENIYNKSKILLITSRFEGIPNIIYESLACETPVISSNVGGISEVINHNKNGFLFDIKNSKKVVDVILNLINNDNLLNEFGRKGRKLMKEQFSWDIIVNQIISVYKNLIR